MLRVQIDICPPEGERRTLHSFDVERVDDVEVHGYAAYRVTAKPRGGQRKVRMVAHRIADGADVLVTLAMTALGRAPRFAEEYDP